MKKQEYEKKTKLKKMRKNGRKEKKSKSKEKSELQHVQIEPDMCPVCHVDIHCEWIHCDRCDVWRHMHCTLFQTFLL